MRNGQPVSRPQARGLGHGLGNRLPVCNRKPIKSAGARDAGSADLDHSQRKGVTKNNENVSKKPKKASMLSTDNTAELGAGAADSTSPGEPTSANDTLTTILELLSHVQDEANALADETRCRHLALPKNMPSSLGKRIPTNRCFNVITVQLFLLVQYTAWHPSWAGWSCGDPVLQAC